MEPAIRIGILHFQHATEFRHLPLAGAFRGNPDSGNWVITVHTVSISSHSFLERAFRCAPHPLDTHSDKQVPCLRFTFDTGPAVHFAVSFGAMPLQACYDWPGMDDALTGQNYERLSARRSRTRTVRDHQTLYRRALPLQRVRCSRSGPPPTGTV